MDEPRSSTPAAPDHGAARLTYLASPAELDLFESEAIDWWTVPLTDVARALVLSNRPVSPSLDAAARYGFLMGQLTAQFVGAMRAGEVAFPSEQAAYRAAAEATYRYFEDGPLEVQS